MYRVFVHRAVGLDDEILDHHMNEIEANETARRETQRTLGHSMVGELSQGTLEAHQRISARLEEVEWRFAAILASRKSLPRTCNYVG